MNAIVSVCRDWGIGRKGELLVSNPADMRRFVELTRGRGQAAGGGDIGGTVVMGRKTQQSFPGGRPLKGRRNIVLTREITYAPAGFEVAHDLDELDELIAGDDPEHTWCIGGATVYELLLPRCEHAFVTMNDIVIDDADTFFPILDADPAWFVESHDGGGTTEEGVRYEFLTYTQDA